MPVFYGYLVFQTIVFSLPMKITSKESSSTPLHFEISLFSSRFNCETTEKKMMRRLSNSILFAPSKTRVLCNAVNTGEQSDTNSETTQFTHSTDWLTHIFKSTQAALPFPAKMPFHSFPLFMCSLILYSHHIWGHLWLSPVWCSKAWHWR